MPQKQKIPRGRGEMQRGTQAVGHIYRMPLFCFADTSCSVGHADEEGGGGIIRASLLYNRGTSRMALKQYLQAFEDLHASLSLRNCASTLALIAKCQLAFGDPVAALRDANVALSDDPGDKIALEVKRLAKQMQSDLDKSRQAWKDKEWQEAKSALEAAVKACRGDRPMLWWTWEISIQIAMKNWSEASRLAAYVPSPRCLLAATFG